MNTTGSDATPRDLLKTLTDKMGDPEYWTKNAVTYGTGAGMVYSLSTKAYKGSRFQSDRTVAGIKMVATNPEAGLFKSATNFHFDDGTVLDFRGDPKHSFGANRARWRIPTRGGPRNLSGRSSSSAKWGRKGGSSSTGS